VPKCDTVRRIQDDVRRNLIAINVKEVEEKVVRFTSLESEIVHVVVLDKSVVVCERYKSYEDVLVVN
jgi:hypothetical protein